MIRICLLCEEEYEDSSQAKIKAGGLITHCPDCSSESEVKYIGLQSADGKQPQATILQFNSDSDRNKYLAFWKNNTGFNKGKSCQLGNHLSTTPKINFKTVSGFNPTNHKGKL